MTSLLIAPESASILLASSAAILAELGVFMTAFARTRRGGSDPARRFSWTPEIIALGVLLFPLAAAARVWRAALGEILLASGTVQEPGTVATHLVNAISGQLGAGFALSLGLGVCALIGPLGLGLCLRARYRTDAPRYATLLLVGLVLMGSAGVVLMGGVLWADLQIADAFRSISLSDPADKASALNSGLTASLGTLSFWIVVAALLFGASIVTLSAGALARPRAATPTTMRDLVFSGALTAMGTLLMLEVWPFHLENAAPALPFDATGALIQQDPSIEKLDVRGPDPIERAPIITISPDRLTIEGIPATAPSDLRTKLEEMRKLDEMMHTGRSHRRDVLFVVDAKTGGDRLYGALAAASAAGYDRGCFAFQREGWIDRPLLGRLHMTGATGAVFDIEPTASHDERIEIRGSDDFAGIAERVVEARRKGRTVALVHGP